MSDDAIAAKPHHLQIRDDVRAKLLEHGGAKVRELVITELSDAQILARKVAVLATLTRLDDMHRNIQKLENSGAVSFDRENKPVGVPTFTKDQLKNLREAGEAYTKLQNTLRDAFEKDEWPKLIEASKQKSGEQQQNAPAAQKDSQNS